MGSLLKELTLKCEARALASMVLTSAAKMGSNKVRKRKGN